MSAKLVDFLVLSHAQQRVIARLLEVTGEERFPIPADVEECLKLLATMQRRAEVLASDLGVEHAALGQAPTKELGLSLSPDF